MNSKKAQKSIFMRIDIFLLLILLSTFFLSIGYAQFSDITLEITGSAGGFPSNVIYISDITFYSSDTTNTASYSDVKSSLLFSNHIELGSNADSYYTIAVTVYNNSGSSKYFYGITADTTDENFYTNNDIIYEYSNIELNEEIKNNSSYTFYIKFSYNTSNITSNVLDAYLGIIFKDYTTNSASSADDLLSIISSLTEAGGEIILTNDITMSGSLEFNSGGDVILNLADNALATTELSNGDKLIIVSGSTNLTIKAEGGNLESNEIGIYMDSDFTGTVIVEGISLNTVGDCGIRNSGTGTLIIKDSTIVSTEWAAINNNSTGSVHIYTSTLTGSNYATKNDGGGTVIIYSGTFKGDTTIYNSSGTTTIYGGSFYDTSFANYLADGYSYSVDSDTGYYAIE